MNSHPRNDADRAGASGLSRRSVLSAMALAAPAVALGWDAAPAWAAPGKPLFVSAPRAAFESSGLPPIVIEHKPSGSAQAGVQLAISFRGGITWSDGTRAARKLTTGSDGRITLRGLRTPSTAGWTGIVATAASGTSVASITVNTGTPQSRLQNVVDFRFGMFNHFNLGTFTDEEWAAGGQSPSLFAPAQVDCGQWADAAAAAGMTFGVLTTKHHDGFALWPTAFGSQNVANSGYTQDIVRSYVDAFRSRGMRVGLYFSVWDRTHTVQGYGGYHVSDPSESIEPSDLTYTLGQIRELLTNYGAIDFFITDGYAWQMGQRNISIQAVRELVHSLQPNCILIDHGGLSTPWLGDAIYFEEPLGIRSPAGNTLASVQGQTISNGWFWHPSTPNEGLMSTNDIVGHLADLEPKYTTFLLNCPPNRDGRLDANVVARLAEVGATWRPNESRPALPAQPLRVEYPVVPASAIATRSYGDEGPMRAIDGYSDNRNETCWSTWGEPFSLPTTPQSLVLDLGGVWSNISSATYLPKQWRRDDRTDGDITSFTISLSVDGTTWTDVASGTWAPDQSAKFVEWTARDAAYVRLTAKAATGDYVNVSGIAVGGRRAKPALLSRPYGGGARYRLDNVNSALALTTDGSRVLQRAAGASSAQTWAIESTDDGFYKIKDVAGGGYLQVTNRNRDNGGGISVGAAADQFTQHWAILRTDTGASVLTNRFSSLVLEVAAGSTADGANAAQRMWGSRPEQRWTITAL